MRISTWRASTTRSTYHAPNSPAGRSVCRPRQECVAARFPSSRGLNGSFSTPRALPFNSPESCANWCCRLHSTCRASSRWRIDGTAPDAATRPWSRSTRDDSPPEQTASLKLSLSLSGEPDRSAARLTMDAGSRRYQFQGAGGNYCFNIESPVSQYTLRQLEGGLGPHRDEPQPLGAG